MNGISFAFLKEDWHLRILNLGNYSNFKIDDWVFSSISSNIKQWVFSFKYIGFLQKRFSIEPAIWIFHRISAAGQQYFTTTLVAWKTILELDLFYSVRPAGFYIWRKIRFGSLLISWLGLSLRLILWVLYLWLNLIDSCKKLQKFSIFSCYFSWG